MTPDAGQGLERAALEDEREFLLASLEDLEREKQAGDISEHDYLALRRSYTSRAASVLRAIDLGYLAEPDGGDEAPEPGGPSLNDHPPVRSKPKKLLVAGLALLLAGVTVAVLVAVTGLRLPGDSVTGSVSLSKGQSLQREMEQARALASQGRYAEAERLFAQVLSSDPRQPEALAYQGWVLRQAGLAGGGQQLLSAARASVEAAVAADPNYPDAHAFLGYIYLEDDHNTAGAVAQFTKFLNDHPPTQMVQLTRQVVAVAFAAVGKPVPPASPPSSS